MLNKNTINKILSPWSSSRANEYTKKRAVETALSVLQGRHQLDKLRLETGAYSQRSHGTGRVWIVDRVNQTISQLGELDAVIKIYDLTDN